MAQDPIEPENTSSQDGNSFNRGLFTDFNESSIPEGAYTRARNATKYSVTGDLNTRSNEPSNLLCNSNIPYTIIGTIHLYGDVWAVFSTDDTNSEIGIFDDSLCQYTRTIHDPCIASTATGCICDSTTTSCLNFNRKNLIKGVSKMNFDCSWQVYFADGNNPDRTINLTRPEFIKDCKTIDGCLICTDTCQIDCDAIRLARLMISPCLNITRGNNGGNLQNGSYFAVVAYTINDQRVTDYFPMSNVQSIFEHENLSGSLEINIENIDTTHFDEFELVIVRTINQQTTAKRIGIYSTRTKHIFLDQISEILIDVPIELIPFRSPVYEKSEAIYEVGTYALRVAPTTKFDFNYQPLANRIRTKWISVEYPSDYYRKGGNVTSYLRDEVYPFFIRWVYDTGDRSSSYHIPGRAAVCTNSSSMTTTEEVSSTDNTFHTTSTLDQVHNFSSYSTVLFQNDNTNGNFNNGGYNSITGVYTAPVDINIRFLANITFKTGPKSNNVIVTIVKGGNTTGTVIAHTSPPLGVQPPNSSHTYTLDTGFINLVAGDTIQVSLTPLTQDGSVITGSTFEAQSGETTTIETTIPASSVCETDPTGSDNIPDDIDPNFPNALPERWEVYNTAFGTPVSNRILSDGGVVIGEGQMGYWESTEIYPDDKPEIWNQSDPSHIITDSTIPGVGTEWSVFTGDLPVQLCGKPIRHHKMPDNLSVPGVTEHFKKYPNGVVKIRVIGVEFDKIRPPRDNEGRLISGIVGYEILKGSREGNKTVIAKGIINNMRQYRLTDVPEDPITHTPVITGLYQNYPYNPLGADPTTGENPGHKEANGGFRESLNAGFNYATGYNKDIFTFHSPDTQFKNPFLSMKELKLYGEYSGIVNGAFSDVPGHPKEKLLSNLAFVVAAILGIASAALAIRGRRTETRVGPTMTNLGLSGLFIGTSSGEISAPGIPGTGVPELGITGGAVLDGVNPGVDGIDSTGNTLANVLAASVLPVQFDPSDTVVKDTVLLPSIFSSVPGMTTPSYQLTTEYPDSSYLGPVLKVVAGLMTFSYYWTLGTDAALNLIESIAKSRQYAYRYISHGFYDNFGRGNAIPGNFRRQLTNANYLDNQFQDFGVNFRINNLYRGKAVAIQTNTPIDNPVVIDNTVQSIHSALATGLLPGGVTNTSSYDPNNVKQSFNTVTSCYYGALKLRLRNQYGQMNSIQEVPITCVFNLDPANNQFITDYSTSEIFGGDTYITRYTEKNSFFYFYDWLLNQPDGTEFDYRLRYMINFPRYWADFTKFETGEFLGNFLSSITTGSNFANALPSGRAALDRVHSDDFFATIFGALTFGIKNAYFYLFQSGVRDFYVESEINTDLRDWGNSPEERHYDYLRYTDTFSLFDPKIIKSGNFFKYDSSLSISRLFINFISWGNQQPRSYNPLIAETCFSFYPFRAIYSLPQNQENKKDYWRSYLANNYKDFKSKITAIEPINKNGAIILFDTASPIQFQGVDTLQTSLGTKITIGDGGLFSQPLQSTTNADESFEYGSCQNRLSVINTPLGLYWMSEDQGKIFIMTDTMKDITLTSGLKFWFKKYLPYFLLKDFPDFELTDNSIVGIGCQATYDNQLEIVYFCKKDFRLKPEYIGRITYTPSCLLSQCTPKREAIFKIDGVQANIVVGDPQYFEDCSWTVSYDPKDGTWISYHDWHPDGLIPSKNSFLSIKGNQIWRHNTRTDSFCNFYGVDYPFELEYVVATGVTVNTLRSLEYYLECYKYDSSGINKYQLLDFNYDHAIISNTEQVSGMLNLNLKPANDPGTVLTYPRINPNSIDILYNKEEQKYRFNSFWDVTDDRGEFTNAQRVIWLNDSNGYTRTLNPANLNYQKNAFQRKRFRHYLTKVSFQRNISGPIKMIMKVAATKLLQSKR